MSSKNEILNERLAKQRDVGKNVFVKGNEEEWGYEKVENFKYFFTLKMKNEKVLNATVKSCSLGAFLHFSRPTTVFTFFFAYFLSLLQRKRYLKGKNFFPFSKEWKIDFHLYYWILYVSLAQLEWNNLFLSCTERKVEISFALAQWKQIRRIKEVINQWVLKHLF